MNQIVKKFVAITAILVLAAIVACGEKEGVPRAERRPLEIGYSITEIGAPPVKMWHYSAPVLCKPKELVWVRVSGTALAPDFSEKVRKVVEEIAYFLLEDHGWELYNYHFHISNPYPSPKLLHCHITVNGHRDGAIKIYVQSKVDSFHDRYFQVESYYSGINKDYLPVLAKRLDEAMKQAREMAKTAKNMFPSRKLDPIDPVFHSWGKIFQDELVVEMMEIVAQKIPWTLN